MIALSGCVTGAGKAKEAAQAKPMPNAAEQLAAALNARAEANARKPGGYRDPLVHNVSGRQTQLAAAQEADATLPASAPPSFPGSVATAPASIAGLVTQPTAVNANRTSIYSSAMPSAMVSPSGQPDGMPGGSPPAYVSPSQGITPVLRSVYSTPPAMAPAVMPLQGAPALPIDQSSQNVVPQVSPQAEHAAPAGSKPVADAPPSKIMPAPGSKARKLDSKEALVVARMLASKSQGGQPAGKAASLKIIGGPMTLTPGMAASLKEPIAFKSGHMPAAINAVDGGDDMRSVADRPCGSPPCHP